MALRKAQAQDPNKLILALLPADHTHGSRAGTRNAFDGAKVRRPLALTGLIEPVGRSVAAGLFPG